MRRLMKVDRSVAPEELYPVSWALILFDIVEKISAVLPYVGPGGAGGLPPAAFNRCCPALHFQRSSNRTSQIVMETVGRPLNTSMCPNGELGHASLLTEQSSSQLVVFYSITLIIFSSPTYIPVTGTVSARVSPQAQ